MDDIHNSSAIDMLLDKWRRRKWLLIACFMLIFPAVATYVMALPSLYKSSTTILFGQDGISEAMVRASVNTELELRLGVVMQAVLSRDQLQAVIDKFDLYPDLRASMPAESVITRLRKDIGIDQRASTQPQWGQNTTYSITITYQGWDAELTAQVANDIAARFKAENERIRTDQAARTTAFIREQLEVARVKFVDQETRINDYRNAHMGELPEQQAINLATLERLNSELRLAGEKQVQLLSRRNELLFGVEDAGGARTSAAGLTGALRLDRLTRDLAELRLRYTDNYPGVIRLNNEIGLLTAEVAATPAQGEQGAVQALRQNPAEIDQELAALVAREKALRSEILALATRIGDAPLIDQQLRSFAYDYDTASEAYVSLQKRYQDALLAESLELQQNQQFRVLETAIPPDFPAGPAKLGLLFMAFVLAAGVAGSSGLVAEYLDRSFHSVADLRRFSRIPVLASIDSMQSATDKWSRKAMLLLGLLIVLTATTLAVTLARQLGQQGERVVWQLAE